MQIRRSILRKYVPWKYVVGFATAGAILYPAWRFGFAELLVSLLLVTFTGLLLRVNKDLRDIQFMIRKTTYNPDLRAHAVDGWKCKVERLVGDDGPGTKETVERHEDWKTELVLWNTGDSTILVVDWDIDAFASNYKPRFWQVDAAILIKPPVAVEGHSIVRVRADLSGIRCRSLYVFYSTSKHQLRRLIVPLTRTWGYNYLVTEYKEGNSE